jgi:Tol biopolymer transport system component
MSRRSAVKSLIGVALVSAIAFLAFAAPASATFPGRNGLVVYTSDRDGDVELWAQNIDGSGVRKFLERRGTVEGGASWSPSGKRLVLYSGPTDETDFDLHLLDANGQGLTPLLTGPTNDAFPQFCDQDTVVFERRLSATDSDVYAVQTDGTGLRPLASGPGFDFAPTCSPDGQRVAFASNRSGTLAVYELPLAPAAARSPAGPPVTLLVSPGTDPDYSPDGKTLAYAGLDPADRSTDIFTIDLVTRATTQISSSPPSHANRLPRFFPEGDGIQWTQLQASASVRALLRLPAGDEPPEKSVQSDHPDFEPIDEAGQAAIRPGPCQCEKLDVALLKETARLKKVSSHFAHLSFDLRWRLLCSPGTVRRCYGKLRVRVATPKYGLLSDHEVSCGGGCDTGIESATAENIRAKLLTHLDPRSGEVEFRHFTLIVTTLCTGGSERLRFDVRLNRKGQIVEVRTSYLDRPQRNAAARERPRS